MYFQYTGYLCYLHSLIKAPFQKEKEKKRHSHKLPKYNRQIIDEMQCGRVEFNIVNRNHRGFVTLDMDYNDPGLLFHA